MKYCLSFLYMCAGGLILWFFMHPVLMGTEQEWRYDVIFIFMLINFWASAVALT